MTPVMPECYKPSYANCVLKKTQFLSKNVGLICVNENFMCFAPSQPEGLVGIAVGRSCLGLEWLAATNDSYPHVKNDRPKIMHREHNCQEETGNLFS
ncbi:MAG TPA: hypothetical protein PKE06_20090 [Flavilitoribacter sp.]|nr:hypothetical protein [Flavilitoribacter sp.]HMQ87282.1 hypothetical protein [Flavilitoribacter sp.]